MEMIFIDGGHDIVTVKSDTKNSLKMISDDEPACIVWHDYTHPEYPDVKEYLDKFAEDNGYTLYHIADTVLCFDLKNVGQEIIDELNME